MNIRPMTWTTRWGLLIGPPGDASHEIGKRVGGMLDNEDKVGDGRGNCGGRGVEAPKLDQGGVRETMGHPGLRG